MAPVTLRGPPSGPPPTRSTVSHCCCPGVTSFHVRVALSGHSGSQPQQEARAGTNPEVSFGSASWLELDSLVLIVIPWTNRVNCTGWPSSPCGNSGAISGPLRWKRQPVCPDSFEPSLLGASASPPVFLVLSHLGMAVRGAGRNGSLEWSVET